MLQNNDKFVLSIRNHNKTLNESLANYDLSGYKKFSQNMFQIITNTTQATLVNLSAQLEWIVVSRKIMGFADLEETHKHFQSKVEDSKKLYEDAIPDDIKGDVEKLIGFTNPSLFVIKKTVDYVTDPKGLFNALPFAKFIKELLPTGNFYKTSVEKWGEDGVFGFQFNNIIWYKGFVYKELIFDNVQAVKDLINQGVTLQDGTKINNMEELYKHQPVLSLFFKASDLLEIYNRPVTTFYTFFKDQNEAILRIALLEAKLGPEPTPPGTPKHNDWINKKADIKIEKSRLMDKMQTDCVDGFARMGDMIPDMYKALTDDDWQGSQLYYSLSNTLATVDPAIEAAWDTYESSLKTAALAGSTTAQAVLDSPLHKATGKIIKGAFKKESSVLNIRYGQKILYEKDTYDIQNDDKFSKKLNDNKFMTKNDLETLGLDKNQKTGFELSDTQKDFLLELFDDTEKNEIATKWKNFVSKANQVTAQDPLKKKSMLLLEMMEYSVKYFDNIFDQLKNKIKELNDEKSEFTVDYNKKITKKVGFEPTPVEFCKKLTFDFELHCETLRLTSVAHMVNVELIFSQIDILKNLLDPDYNDREVITSIAALKKEIDEKYQFINSDESERRLTQTYNNIRKEFTEDSQTLLNFKKTKDNNIKQFLECKRKIYNFCENVISLIKEKRKITNESEKDNFNITLIDEFLKFVDKMNNQIQNDIFPDLQRINNLFRTDITKMKNDLNEKFSIISSEINLKSFDSIYRINYNDKFLTIYNSCKRRIKDGSGDSIISAIAEDLLNKQKVLQKKVNADLSAKESVKDQDKNSNENKLKLSINNSEKNINPIDVTQKNTESED